MKNPPNILINNTKAFSLIELSIFISIAASLLAGYLIWTQPTNITNANKLLITKDRINTISSAIENFVVEKNRLPCPADPYSRADNTRHATGGTDYYKNDYGTEDLDTSDTEINNKTTHGIDCPNTTGAIPTASLNLSEEYSEDAWGKRFTYQVADSLCTADAGTEAGISTTASRLLGCTPNNYKNGNGNIIITDGTNTLTNKAAYVIVSHGTNGKGSFLPSGLKLANGISHELENSDADNTFVKAPKTSNFDDITYFKTKVQIDRLTSHADTKQISVTNCEANSQLLKNLDTTETNAMDTHITGYSSSGQKVGTSMLQTIQSICVKYYGATAATIDGQTWSGAQCPGNTTTNTTYYAPTDTCTCLGGAWDGNCTIDWDALLTVRNGLHFWLDANSTNIFTNTACTTAANNGNNIACWKDKSNNTEHVLQDTTTNQPSYHTNIQNSKPIIRFDNSDKLIGTNLTLFDFQTNDFSWIVVTKTNSGTAQKNSIFGTLQTTSTWPGFTAGYNASEQPYAMYRINSDITATSSTAYTNTWVVITAIRNGPTAKLYINGTEKANINSAGININGEAITIGSSNTADTSEYYDGDIAEILIYNRALTTSERKSIRDYLGTKWDITVQ